MSKEPLSRNEAILQATIDGTEYTAPPQSRIEDLLLQLKESAIVTVTSAEASRNKTNTNSANLTLFRYGKLRILSGIFNPSVTGSNQIATLPEVGDRPSQNTPCICGRGASTDEDSSKVNHVVIGSSVNIVYQGQDVGENQVVNATWVVE